MRRRDLLVGLGSLTAVGGGAALAFGDVGVTTEGVEPVELETINAPGSPAETTTVPERGRVNFLEMFATWCTVCQSMMPTLATVHDAVEEDVQFLSVTNEPLGTTVSRADVADWWEQHGGQWTVATDADLALTQRLSASGVPYAFVFDEQNRIVWSHRGRASAATLEDTIREQI